jgi:hypothetical protein
MFWSFKGSRSPPPAQVIVSVSTCLAANTHITLASWNHQGALWNIENLHFLSSQSPRTEASRKLEQGRPSSSINLLDSVE